MRFFLPRNAAQLLIDRVDIDDARLVDAEHRFRFEDAPHGSVEPFDRNAARAHSALQPFERGIRHRRHQQCVGSSEYGSDSGFARCVTHRDSAHVHRVGDDQSLKMQFVTQHAGQNIVR